MAAYTDDGDGTFEPGTDDDLVATYEYDGANRRIEKTFADDTGVEYFYNQEWQLLEERSVDDEGTPTAINQYVWSARYIDAPIVRFHDGNGDGDLLDAVDNTHYYTGDANCNVTATIDAASGDVVEYHVYSAYGEATIYSPTWTYAAAPATDGPLYCGYFFDAESGMYQVRNRYYDSSLSAFISRDPIEVDWSLYRYVENCPTTATDALGLQISLDDRVKKGRDVLTNAPDSVVKTTKAEKNEWCGRLMWDKRLKPNLRDVAYAQWADFCVTWKSGCDEDGYPYFDGPSVASYNFGNMPDEASLGLGPFGVNTSSWIDAKPLVRAQDCPKGTTGKSLKVTITIKAMSQEKATAVVNVKESEPKVHASATYTFTIDCCESCTD